MSSHSEQQEGPRSEPESAIEHNAYRRAIGNTRSLRIAVNGMCSACMGCNETHMEPGYKKDIRHCTSNHCPLWHFRRYQEKQS